MDNQNPEKELPETDPAIEETPEKELEISRLDYVKSLIKQFIDIAKKIADKPAPDFEASKITGSNILEIMSTLFPYIHCQSDCKFAYRGSCMIARHIIMRDGICRHFDPTKITDRTDMTGGNFLEFIHQQRVLRKSSLLVPVDNTDEDYHDK